MNSIVSSLEWYDKYTKKNSFLFIFSHFIYDFLLFSLFLFLLYFSASHFIFSLLSLFFFFFLLQNLHLSFFLSFFTPFFFFLSLYLHLLYLFFFPLSLSLSVFFCFFSLYLSRWHWDWLSPWSSASPMRLLSWRSLIMISFFFFFLRLWIPCDCDYGWVGSFSSSFLLFLSVYWVV